MAAYLTSFADVTFISNLTVTVTANLTTFADVIVTSNLAHFADVAVNTNLTTFANITVT